MYHHYYTLGPLLCSTTKDIICGPQQKSHTSKSECNFHLQNKLNPTEAKEDLSGHELQKRIFFWSSLINANWSDLSTNLTALNICLGFLLVMFLSLITIDQSKAVSACLKYLSNLSIIIQLNVNLNNQRTPRSLVIHSMKRAINKHTWLTTLQSFSLLLPAYLLNPLDHQSRHKYVFQLDKKRSSIHSRVVMLLLFI